jgi:hypothetical protein
LFSVSIEHFRWSGIGVVQLIFRIIKKFGLMEAFEFANSQLFCFLNSVRCAHSQIPFANWMHAVDVFQFVFVIIGAARLDRVFSKLELFGLAVAAICHDLGHDGFQRVRDAAAVSAYGQLFTFQGIVETEACWNALSIISQDDNNIFSGLSAQQQTQIWGIIIDCILATNFSQHEAILSKFNGALNAGEFDPEESVEHRLLLMQMVLKCADFGGIARPWVIASERCNWITEEYYYEGAVSGSTGISFGAGTRREHIDKQASLVGVIERIVKPIFDSLSKYSASLAFLVDQMESNFSQLSRQRR